MKKLFCISFFAYCDHYLVDGGMFAPMSITPLSGMEDARIVLNVSRSLPKEILNDGEKSVEKWITRFTLWKKGDMIQLVVEKMRK